MSTVTDSLTLALGLIARADAQLLAIVGLSLRVSVTACAIGALGGLAFWVLGVGGALLWAVLMAFLSLWTGAFWGKPMWGTWWVWDARLTSMFVLMLLYIGYMAIWAAIVSSRR